MDLQSGLPGPLRFGSRWVESDAASVILAEPGGNRLLLGAYSDACSTEQLLEHDVFMVVNCALECPTPSLSGSPVVLTRRLELADDEEQVLGAALDVTDDIHDVLELGKSVLVHCAAGVSRSATVVLAYLVRHRRLSLSDAWALASAARCIRPNLGFWAQLMRFELRERGALSVAPQQLELHPAWPWCNTKAQFRGLLGDDLPPPGDPPTQLSGVDGATTRAPPPMRAESDQSEGAQTESA
jgi:hypothetical protein